MQLNFAQFDFVTFFQMLKPLFFVKGVLILLLLGYMLFQFVIFRQIKSMEKVITQPISSDIVAFISLAFMAASVILMIAVWALPI